MKSGDSTSIEGGAGTASTKGADSGRALSRGLQLGAAAILWVAGVVGGAGSCASAGAGSASRQLTIPTDAGTVASAVLAAAPGCDLGLVSAASDEKTGSVRIVLLGDWRAPRPESALVEVRLERSPDGTAVKIQADVLAEHGMKAPDAEGGDGGCTPCAQTRAKAGLVQFSRGLALGNAIRATGCIGDALEGKDSVR